MNINRKLVLRGQPETTRVWQLIRDQVELTNSQVEALTTPQNGEDEATSLDDDDPFILYRSVGYGGLRLHLKWETPVHGGRRFYELDLRRSLRSNLRGKTIVEHPVLHVVMRADECVYRAPADAFQTAGDLPERKGEEGEMEVGEQEKDARDANPEAFGQYFDFYLNYYTQKFSRESGGVTAGPKQHGDAAAQLSRVTSSAGNGSTSSAVRVPPSAGNVTSPAVGVTSSAGSVSPVEASRDSLLPPPEFDATQPPDLSPFAAVGSNKSKHWPSVAAHKDSSQAMDIGGADGSKNQRPVSSQSGRTRYTSVPLRNAALEQALAVKNKLNAVRAQKLREELRQSALVAYDDSDSE